MSNVSPEFDKLLKLSADIGSDPLLVQAAGGNTSIKQDDTLWIKASGTWLMNAVDTDIMVPVSLPALLTALDDGNDHAERAQAFVDQARNPAGLRPSIETTVHAVMAQRVVVHVHCVNTIAIAIRNDAQSILEQKLAAFNWLLIPYMRPGLPLSRAIAKAAADKPAPPDVIVLGNHGLVVAADSTELTLDLLRRVCRALEQPFRKSRNADTDALLTLAEHSDYQLPASAACHATAINEINCRIAGGGSLYPDHVIFLGMGSAIAATDESANDVARRYAQNALSPPKQILFPGVGTLLHHSADASTEAMALCLADVTARTAADAPLNYLTNQQNDELLNWDAEKYRQAMNQNNT